MAADVVPWWIIAYVGLASASAFVACLVDKARASTGARRISERSLLWIAFAGGSPGLWLGILVARHKVRKPTFLLRLFGVAVAQWALALAWAAWRERPPAP